MCMYTWSVHGKGYFSHLGLNGDFQFKRIGKTFTAINTKIICKFQGLTSFLRCSITLSRKSIVMSLNIHIRRSIIAWRQCFRLQSIPDALNLHYLQHLPHQLIHDFGCPAYHLSASELVVSFIMFLLGDCSWRRSDFLELCVLTQKTQQNNKRCMSPFLSIISCFSIA